MDAQRESALGLLRRCGVERVGAGTALRLGRLGGELRVVQGRAWLTRRGEAGDRLAVAGERVLIAVDDDAVIEPYDAGSELAVVFAPRRRGIAGAVFEVPLRVLAWATTVAAMGLVALARALAAGARSTQGRIA